MGLPSPQDAAPAYDDVVHNHVLSNFAPSACGSGYAAVPQDDDVEQSAHMHGSSTPPAQPQETFAQTIASVFRPKPHVHCETCDVQMEARQRREQQKHCCAMVAWVFMVLFFCCMILGIVIANNVGRSKSHRRT